MQREGKGSKCLFKNGSEGESDQLHKDGRATAKNMVEF